MTSPSDGSLYPFSVVADAVVASFDMRDIRGICPTGIFSLVSIEIVSLQMKSHTHFIIIQVPTLVVIAT